MKNKYVQILVTVAVTVLVTVLVMPETTKIVTKEVIKEVEVEKIVEVEKVVEVAKEVVKEVVVSERKTKRVTKFADGTVIEEEIYENNQAQIERVLETEYQRYASMEAEYQRQLEFERSKKVVIRNKKRVNVYAGYNPLNANILAGASYNIAGPFTVGAAGTSEGAAYLTLGLRF